MSSPHSYSQAATGYLTGTVEYRLALDGGDSPSATAGTKRPRPSKEDASAGKNSSWVRNAGYFFVPDAVGHSDAPSSRNRRHRGYPIVYPYSCIDTICKAAITGSRAKVTRYEWTNFGHASIDEDESSSCDDEDSEGRLHSQDTNESASSFASTGTRPTSTSGGGGPIEYSAKVLEIRRGGVAIVEPERLAETEPGHSKKDEPQAMTLLAFAELEEKMRSTSKGSGGSTSSNQGRSSSERYSVTARIDATSAIIATLPSDPFALVELYEESPAQSNEAPLSAVAVLRGRSALAAHAALQPGTMVTFTRILRQRWHINKSFEDGKLDSTTAARLKHRAPSHVFVVNHGRSISWSLDCERNKESTDIGPPKKGGQIAIRPPTLPSTPVPLIAVQGLITSLRRASLGAGGEIIHSISIDSLDGRKSKLYLTYYPLTPELIWGLRRGAYIQAINVHPVDGGAWGNCGDDNCRVLGASIRSTVVILDLARRERQENRHSNASSSLLLTQAPEMPQVPATKCRPYSFINMKLTYDEMEWREQLRSVWYDRSDMELVTDDSFDTIFNNLLAQHEKATKVRDSAFDDRQKSKRKRKGKRDAYVEFFYHPCDNFLLRPPVWPVVMPFEKIRNGCVGEFRRLLQEYSPSSLPNIRNENQKLMMKSGWTASKSFGRESLSKILVGRHNDDIPFYACGIASSKLLSLRDGSCQLPVCLGLCDDDASGASLESHLLASCGMRVQDGSTVALPVSSIVVSCMCLGPKPKAASPNDESIQYLPVPSAMDGISTGSCAMFVVNDFLFIASAHIRWNGPQIIRSSSSGRSKKSLTTIQESLSVYSGAAANNSEGDPINTFVAGRLVRSRFGLRKIQNDTYKGCVLTLSHLPFHRSDFNRGKVERDAREGVKEPCDVQTIELKLIANNILGRATRQVKQTLRQLLQRVEEVDSKNHTAVVSHSVCDDQIGLATAWWCIADDARYTPFLCGGRDELQIIKGGQRSYSDVYVRFPLAARETSEQGYRRFKCTLDDIVSFAATSSRETEDISVGFDHVGGEKFLPGMIDRLPDRYKTAGERLQPCLPESLSGIPTRNLAQLHWNMCREISQKTRTAMEPSLAVRITDARLLGVTFCRARAECTHCYRFLIHRGKKDVKPTEAKSGVVTSVRLTTPSSTNTTTTSVRGGNDTINEKSFWHMPLGDECDAPRPEFTKDMRSPSKSAPKEKKSPTSPTKASVRRTVRSNLRCPNECPIDVAAIKWEISGIIDDGTGQAKLHAEREAALALLGEGLDVKSVEDGAWTVEGGITYQKSVPPRSFIRNAIREAQMAAQALARETSHPAKKRKVGPQDVLSLLTPEAKGDYTLQRYCRFSNNPMRSMDVVCRCKPIPDKAGDRELNRTDVEVTTARCEEGQAAVTTDAITYTLPPLKLNLVDLFAIPTTPREDGWSLVQALDS